MLCLSKSCSFLITSKYLEDKDKHIKKARFEKQEEHQKLKFIGICIYSCNKISIYFIDDTMKNDSLIQSTNPVNRKRYMYDLNAKLSLLRLEMYEQMGVIDKINQLKELQERKIDIDQALKQIKVSYGVPK